MTKFEGVELTPEKKLNPDLVKLCKSITAKRARTVIDHILKHGIITNEDLSDQYGYDHPPRAIRDVRENGIPLITSRITSPKTGLLAVLSGQAGLNGYPQLYVHNPAGWQPRSSQ